MIGHVSDDVGLQLKGLLLVRLNLQKMIGHVSDDVGLQHMRQKEWGDHSKMIGHVSDDVGLQL